MPGPHPEPPSAQSPFARHGCYLRRRDVQHLVSGRYPAFNAPTNSCVGPNPSCRLGCAPRRQVFAGCRQSLLGDGPSRRYLRSLCQGAWTCTPRVPLALPICVSFRETKLRGRRPNLWVTRLGTPDVTCDATSTGGGFRGGSHSLRFRLPDLLGPPVAPTVARRCLRSGALGSRAVYITQWTWGYPPRTVISLRARNG
jgi:hypothetical protein